MANPKKSKQWHVTVDLELPQEASKEDLQADLEKHFKKTKLPGNLGATVTKAVPDNPFK